MLIAVELPLKGAAGYSERCASLFGRRAPSRGAASSEQRFVRACVVNIVALHEAEALRSLEGSLGARCNELESADALLDALALQQ